MLLWPDAGFILVAALAFDAAFGDPDWLWRRLPHPIVLIGATIATLDRRLNHATWPSPARRLAGGIALGWLAAAALTFGWLLEFGLRLVPGGQVLIAAVAAILLAQRSLYQHVARVRAAFASGGLEAARLAVAAIVGRDPESLDQSGVCRAAIESCAENFSDGVVAPAFWFALLGLPGLLAYKAVNTADSMIGHRTPRHEAFGWAAARFDDVVNFIPARLSGVLIALVSPTAGGSVAQSLRIMLRDAGLHRSPNAGWPESAMAAALGLVLAGPRRYAGRMTDDRPLNAESRQQAGPDDIDRALKILVGACILHGMLYAVVALVV
jgi:adenosylcobinamide-phosphate synthase